MSTRLLPSTEHRDELVRPRRLVPLVAGGVGLIAVLVLSALLLRHHVPFVSHRDSALERAAHRASLASPATVRFANDASYAGVTWVRGIVFVVVAALLAWRRAWHSVGFLTMAVVGGLGLANLVKLVVDRPRPHFAHPLGHAVGTSFPSGHVMGATVLYVTLVVVAAPLLPRWATLVATVLVGLLIAAVGAARVLLGLHYTSDVFAGLLLGLAWVAVSAGALGFDGRRGGARSR